MRAKRHRASKSYTIKNAHHTPKKSEVADRESSRGCVMRPIMPDVAQHGHCRPESGESAHG